MIPIIAFDLVVATNNVNAMLPNQIMDMGNTYNRLSSTPRDVLPRTLCFLQMRQGWEWCKSEGGQEDSGPRRKMLCGPFRSQPLRQIESRKEEDGTTSTVR